MRFSILINNYNYGAFLTRAIESALGQTYPDVEVIVVDDGSTDNSRDVIGRYGGSIKSILKENGGQASCFNAGFGAATGDVICLLDSDDHFLPEKIAKLADMYAANIGVGWIFHSMIYENANGQVTGASTAVPAGRIDLRHRIRFGFARQILPATSALTFRREILGALLPMREAPGISIGDHYLKFGALMLCPGFQSDLRLAVQKIHDRNHYTNRGDSQKMALIMAQTAIALKERFPKCELFCDNLMGTAQALLSNEDDNPARNLVNDYVRNSSPLGRARVSFWKIAKKRRARGA